MGAAYFIVLEQDIDGLDTMMNGKDLSRHMDDLDAVAGQLGVRPLSEYFSADPEQVAAFMQSEGMDAEDIQLPPIQQFSASDGLITVRALLSASHSESESVADDLRACERILSVASDHGIGWHFEIDF